MEAVKKYLAIDFGNARIGLAMTNSIARMPSPFKTLQNSEHVKDEIISIIKTENIDVLVVGLPRNLSGQDTHQTEIVRAFGTELLTLTSLPLYYQDEALTSKKAESELNLRGRQFTSADIDALSAVYILEDFLASSNRAVV
ncbi:MAG: Holliday junction resolvase RuvX [Candidatus Saccharimonadales bacterium]